MAKAEKVTAVAELKEEFQSSNGAVLADYRGLSVAALGELRRSLGDSARFAVVKNTLTKIALREAGMADALEGFLEGPSAVAFVKGDPVEAAKGMRDFARTNPALVVKGGLIEGTAMSPADVERLADLESREAVLAGLAGTLQAPLSNAAALLDALPTKTARLADALRAKLEESGGGAAQEAAQESIQEPEPVGTSGG